MKLSIITVNLNNREGLERTIQSVISQTFTDFEYIIIDGGSTDGSVDSIKQFAHQITYWVSEPDKGIYSAMNKGIAKAQGEYLLFLNSGDELYNNKVINDIFIMNVWGHDLIYGNIKRTFPDLTTDIVNMPNNLTIKFMLEATLTHPTTFIKKELFRKYGYYRDDLNIVSDWAFFLRVIVFAKTTSIHIDKIIANFYMNGVCSKEENQKLIHEERKKIIDESFSSELMAIYENFNIYKSFYERPLFRIIRKYQGRLKKAIRITAYRKCAFKNRIPLLMRFFDKTINKQLTDPLSIPIIIINYNRLEYLKQLVSFLQKRKHNKIVIIDNNSTYPPLLDYYKHIQDTVEIERMDVNLGHLVLWKTQELCQKYCSGYYIVTDSDIIPNENLPKNYVSILIKVLNKNPNVKKVGFALRIDDLPNHFLMRENVINWEKKFWEKEIDKDAFLAPIDTTFAIYLRQQNQFDLELFFDAIRIGGNFTAKHGGWYVNSEHLTEEESYYYKTSNDSNTWKMNQKGQLVVTEKNHIYKNK